MKKRKKKVDQTTPPKARRLARAQAWLAAYDGLPENIYRKKFHVDILTAIRDLQELGYEFRPGYAEAVEAGEKRRMEQKAAEKLERQEQERMERYPDSDDRFFYIAGYTSGGAPYGVTWEQMGMEPYGDLSEALPEENWEPDEEDEPDDEMESDRVPLERVPNTLHQEMINAMRAELCAFIDEHGCRSDDKNALYIREDAAFSVEEALSAVLHIPSIPDPGTLVPLYERALEITLAEYARDGIEVKDASWLLTMLETPRLILRKLTRKVELRLQGILGNPEVMYAWEHGFSPEETRHWMNQQIASYSKYRCGYWAAVLRDSGEMIGFIGVLRSKIRKQTAYEIGYILDKPYWRQGYALEGARACLGYAFDTLVFCTHPPGKSIVYPRCRAAGNANRGRICEALQWKRNAPFDLHYQQGCVQSHFNQKLNRKHKKGAMREKNALRSFCVQTEVNPCHISPLPMNRSWKPTALTWWNSCAAGASSSNAKVGSTYG